ncbi:MAG: transcriptional repressor [Cyclobacteriaceae bacterium]
MLEDKLENRDIKPTAMRLLVLRQLVESSAALSLGDLEAKFEKADKVTLYRTLKTFEDKKLIHAIADGTGAVKYALCAEDCECEPQDQHIHFHCVKCGETLCLSQSKVPRIQIPTGFKADSASMLFKGVCASCG